MACRVRARRAVSPSAATGPARASKTLVERWNGTSWSIVASPNPSGATDAALSGVSCPSTSSCYAVGYYSTTSATKTLVERWNGTSWSIVASPNPSDSTAELDGVACPSATSCYAVGSYFDSADKTLVERWNGTSWSIVASPNPSGATDSFLSGVSCPSTTSCYAVGQRPVRRTRHHVGGAMERDELVDRRQPQPGAAQPNSDLGGVACPSATSCFAVGGYFDGSTPTRRWWSIGMGRAGRSSPAPTRAAQPAAA